MAHELDVLTVIQYEELVSQTLLSSARCGGGGALGTLDPVGCESWLSGSAELQSHENELGGSGEGSEVSSDVANHDVYEVRKEPREVCDDNQTFNAETSSEHRSVAVKVKKGSEIGVARMGSKHALHTQTHDELCFAHKVGTILGPKGPGILAIRNVPGVAELRQRLLPQAKKLALMSNERRRVLLKAHNLSTDVPLKRKDRPVTAFASQVRYGHNQPLPANNAEFPLADQGDNDERELGTVMRELGNLLVDVGLLVAQLCDQVCPAADLENLILESGTAKGRLIHYHSQLERSLLASSESKRVFANRTPKPASPSDKINSQRERLSQDPAEPDSWQSWHFDYGLLTLLTAPMYLRSNQSGPPSKEEQIEDNAGPSAWTHEVGHHSGLTIMFENGPKHVSVPSDCVLVQVGEAAQIVSGGKLAAIAHRVDRPEEEDVSRETFVVFLQPAWQRVLNLPPRCDESMALQPRGGEICSGVDIGRTFNGTCVLDRRCTNFRGLRELASQPKGYLLDLVPSLVSRWRKGCTFAEFSKLTTSQYYGTDGRQSQKRTAF